MAVAAGPAVTLEVRAREARAAPPAAADQQTLVQTAEMEAMEKTVEMGEMDFRRWRQRIQLCYRLTLLTGGGGGERGEDIFTSGGDGGDGGRGAGGSDGNNGEAGGAGGGGGAFDGGEADRRAVRSGVVGEHEDVDDLALHGARGVGPGDGGRREVARRVVGEVGEDALADAGVELDLDVGVVDKRSELGFPIKPGPIPLVGESQHVAPRYRVELPVVGRYRD